MALYLQSTSYLLHHSLDQEQTSVSDALGQNTPILAFYAVQYVSPPDFITQISQVRRSILSNHASR
jgi:hypothetical protein